MNESDADPTRSCEDALIVVRCQLGEASAFDELIRRWHRPMWQYLRRQAGCNDIAADLAQDVWLRVFRGIARLRDGRKLRAWLFGIARRAWMDHLRSSYALVVDDLPDVDRIAFDPGATNPDDDDAPCDLDTMHRELARLPAVEREVLTLFYLDDLSLTDVSQVLEVPIGTVKSRLFRARRLLRHELEFHGASP